MSSLILDPIEKTYHLGADRRRNVAVFAAVLFAVAGLYLLLALPSDILANLHRDSLEVRSARAIAYLHRLDLEG